MAVKCLLCRERDVYYIKSHLTPAGITENTYGKRGKELIYTIDAEHKKVGKYFGPEYPQQETTEVKEIPTAKKGIFCKQCEVNFSLYESIVQPHLNELANGIGHGMDIKRVKGIKFIEIEIHPNILISFFQSIVWRQCIEQEMSNKDNPFGTEQLEHLRLLVLDNIYTPVKQIVQKDLTSNPKMSIFTTYNTKSPETPSFANPHVLNTNPFVFFIGPFVLLYWLNGHPTEDLTVKTNIETHLLDEELLLAAGRAAIINERPWQKIHQKIATYAAEEYLRS